jgi:hypothetical protein
VEKHRQRHGVTASPGNDGEAGEVDFHDLASRICSLLVGGAESHHCVCVICPSKLKVSDRADSQVECHGHHITPPSRATAMANTARRGLL